MIVVATADFEVYHEVVTELRDRGATFTTVEPGDPLPESTEVLVTGAEEDPEVPEGVAVVRADPGAPRRAVEAALGRLRGESGRTVVGVDPGTRPGIAVLSGDTVVAAYQVPLASAAETVRETVAGAPDPVVRIGDGARLQGARVIEELDDVRVELVDETGTTPHLGAGARGAGDLLAAVNIARREGEVIEDRAVEPTAGELTAIKAESRERSEDNREIDETLARRVAAGELTIEEALAEHAGSDRPGDGAEGEARGDDPDPDPERGQDRDREPDPDQDREPDQGQDREPDPDPDAGRSGE